MPWIGSYGSHLELESRNLRTRKGKEEKLLDSTVWHELAHLGVVVRMLKEVVVVGISLPLQTGSGTTCLAQLLDPL